MAGCGALVVLACVLGACSPSDPATAPEAAPSDTSEQHTTHTPTPAVSAAAGSAAPAAAPSSPAEAAIRLESLVGQHSLLVGDLMRARISSQPDLAQAANSALTKNTTAMGTLLEPVIGADGVKTFADGWGTHIAEFAEYARGLADDDEKITAQAKRELVDYEKVLAEFFVAGSKGRLDQKTAESAVKAHVDHLLEHADAYAAGDYEEATEIYRVSYAHSFQLGEALARALLPDSVGKELDTPSLQLRAALTRLLGEHVALVVAAMRAAVTGADDFEALGDATNANTLDLTGAMEALFGADAAKGFQSEWSDHVDGLITYTRAVAEGDKAGQERARSHLREFEQTFATFLDGATEGRLGQPALAQMYVMHDRMLLAQIDAYAAKDYPQAHDLGYQTYDEMFTVAAQLSTAIGSTVAKRLPTGGSQTGGGGAAGLVVGRGGR